MIITTLRFPELPFQHCFTSKTEADPGHTWFTNQKGQLSVEKGRREPEKTRYSSELGRKVCRAMMDGKLKAVLSS